MDTSLIRRIRTGNPARFRTAWHRTGSDASEHTVDLLAQAVDKAELANRFGAVRLRLREHAAAVAFFRTALDLATPGSPVAVNAASNLATARQQLGDRDPGHIAAFDGQVAAGDPENALVTAANLLRSAAKDGRRVDERWLRRVPLLADQVTPPSLRVALLASALGALSVYHAARGDHGRAATASTTLVELLCHPQPEPARHLMELAAWYAETGDLERAATRGLSDGRLLEAARLPEPAALSYLQAANTALEAHAAGARHASSDSSSPAPNGSDTSTGPTPRSDPSGRSGSRRRWRTPGASGPSSPAVAGGGSHCAPTSRSEHGGRGRRSRPGRRWPTRSSRATSTPCAGSPPEVGSAGAARC